MLYRTLRVIVESDGEVKYDPAGDRLVLVKEKRRQEALECAGYVVVRVTWWEVQNEPWEVVARVRHKLAAGARELGRVVATQGEQRRISRFR